MLRDLTPYQQGGIAREAQYFDLDERSLGACITLPRYAPADAHADYEATYHTDPYAPEVEATCDLPPPWWLPVVVAVPVLVFAAFVVKFALCCWEILAREVLR